MNGSGFVAGVVGIGTLIVVASILFQAGKAPNTVPALKTVSGGVNTVVKTLYKS